MVDNSVHIENQPSNYFNLKYIEISNSSGENDVFSQSDVDDFLDSNVEANNSVYLGINSDDDLKIDDFENLKKKIQKFKDDVIYFFHSVCYAVKCILTQREKNCTESEMREDLPGHFYEKMLEIKVSLILDLRLNFFLKVCVSKLMNYSWLKQCSQECMR